MGSVSNRVLLCRWTTVNQVLINAASHLLSKIHSLCVQLIGALHAPLILASLRQDDRGGDEFEERHPSCCGAAKRGAGMLVTFDRMHEPEIAERSVGDWRVIASA
jgi:hypothetical protein